MRASSRECLYPILGAEAGPGACVVWALAHSLEDVLRLLDARVGWRRQLAEWAELPFRSIPARIAETVQAAFDDLDTRRARTLLRDLALDASVPTGARFVTFFTPTASLAWNWLVK
jgi:hypothetical protein